MSRRIRSAGPYRVLLFAFILLYVWIFTALAFGQHAGMRTHKADLGQIDQAVWNSSRGRFLEMTDYGYISSRLIDHVEPILVAISPVFWLWDDVRAILLLQVVFVAFGAWLLFELALVQLTTFLSAADRSKIWLAEPVRQLAGMVALSLGVAYLLAPQLQSAVLTEFHAIPLATPFILWTFWAIATRHWWQFAVATAFVALVKEESALLAAGLGAWAMWRIFWEYRVHRDADGDPFPWGVLSIAGIVTVLSVAWFVVATFVIVPAHAAEVYGVAESGYFQRYGALGDSPVDIARSMVTKPLLVWQIASQPARLAYLRDLAMPYGFLSILAPEVVLLSLPVLMANLLSAYPAQYYGEFHYSAPVAVFFAVGAAYGAARFWRWSSRRTSRSSADFQHLPAAGIATMTAIAALRNSRAALRPLITVILSLWILGWAVHAYATFGRGPMAARHDVTPVEHHHRLLDRFVTQIPKEAAVTATAAVHPHLSHRRYIYQFPAGLESPVPADWALLDVTTATDMAPGDLRATVERMLAGEWGVVDAADGFMLLHKGAPDRMLPPDFYDFARTRADAPPASDIPLQFIDAQVDDWARWRTSTVTTRWRVGEGFDASTMQPQIEIRSPTGERLYRFADAHPPELVWYPPGRWQPGDEVSITTLPLHLPRDFGIVVEHTPGLTVGQSLTTSAVDDSALIAAYRRGPDDELHELHAPDASAAEWAGWLAGEVDEESTGGDAIFRLPTGDELLVQARIQDRPYQPGESVDVWLSWSSEGGWPQGMSVFAHLRADGENVDQNDGSPRYFVKYDADRALRQQEFASDWRQFKVPVDYESATNLGDMDWSVVIGVYDSASGERASAYTPEGALLGNELVVARLEIGRPRIPDQSCALLPDTCNSQPK